MPVAPVPEHPAHGISYRERPGLGGNTANPSARRITALSQNCS